MGNPKALDILGHTHLLFTDRLVFLATYLTSTEPFLVGGRKFSHPLATRIDTVFRRLRELGLYALDYNLTMGGDYIDRPHDVIIHMADIGTMWVQAEPTSETDGEITVWFHGRPGDPKTFRHIMEFAWTMAALAVYIKRYKVLPSWAELDRCMNRESDYTRMANAVGREVRSDD